MQMFKFNTNIRKFIAVTLIGALSAFATVQDQGKEYDLTQARKYDAGEEKDLRRLAAVEGWAVRLLNRAREHKEGLDKDVSHKIPYWAFDETQQDGATLKETVFKIIPTELAALAAGDGFYKKELEIGSSVKIAKKMVKYAANQGYIGIDSWKQPNYNYVLLKCVLARYIGVRQGTMGTIIDECVGALSDEFGETSERRGRWDKAASDLKQYEEKLGLSQIARAIIAGINVNDGKRGSDQPKYAADDITKALGVTDGVEYGAGMLKVIMGTKNIKGTKDKAQTLWLAISGPVIGKKHLTRSQDGEVGQLKEMYNSIYSPKDTTGAVLQDNRLKGVKIGRLSQYNLGNEPDSGYRLIFEYKLEEGKSVQCNGLNTETMKKYAGY